MKYIWLPLERQLQNSYNFFIQDVLVGRYEQIDLKQKLQILSSANATEKDNNAANAVD